MGPLVSLADGSQVKRSQGRMTNDKTSINEAHDIGPSEQGPSA